MSEELNLVAREFISVNHYLGYRAVPKGKKAIVIPFTKKEAKEFKKSFAKHAEEEVEKQGWDIEKTRHKHHYMDCVYYFPRVDMDEQNYFKCLCDALNGIAYIDDSNVLTRTNEIYYDNKNPRIEIKITPVEYEGIFPNKESCVKFEEKCSGCRRYKNNCSILKKAKEGRIQDEINEDLICSSFKQIKI